MISLSEEQIISAKKEKKRYLLSLLMILLIQIAAKLVTAYHIENNFLKLILVLISIGAVVFAAVITWRFCRSIGIGITMTVLNTLTSPIFFIIQLIVLLRIYAKRTGIGLTFLMGDKVP